MEQEEVQARVAGRDFEREMLGKEGFLDDLGPLSVPDYLDFDSSLNQVVESNWAKFAHSLEKGEVYCHNPASPRMGKTHSLWAAVKNWLPGAVNGESHLPLNLYISVGRNALDYWHGVDVFFWWQGEYVTIDFATHDKRKKGTLKADFVFTPRDLEHSRLLYFGKQVAKLLLERKTHSKELEIKAFKKSLTEGLNAGLR